MQYLPVAWGATDARNVALWQLQETDLAEAGPLRYVKDGFVLFVCIYALFNSRLLITDARKLHTLKSALYVIAAVATLGLLPYLIGATPWLILQAGARWIMLLVFALLVWAICATHPPSLVQQRNLGLTLLALGVANTGFMIVQAATASTLLGLHFGAARVTGFFGNAGAAAFFSLALALVAVNLRSTSVLIQVALFATAVIGAAASGTRFAMITVFCVFVLSVYEHANRRSRLGGKLFLGGSLLSAVLLYQYMIAAVDRGGILEAGLSSGGRLTNLALVTGRLLSSGTAEVLFGRGLGVGTNTAQTLLVQSQLDPESVRFQWLVDNAFLTLVFQVGVVGSIIFWLGFSGFMTRRFTTAKEVGRAQIALLLGLMLMTFFAGSPFEQYFLMLGYAASLGMAEAGRNSTPAPSYRVPRVTGRVVSD